MQVVIGKECGFCFGVQKAIEKVKSLAKEGEVSVLGEIIHNETVTAQLKDLGVHTVNSLDEVIGNRLVIRTHGAGKKTFSDAKERGFIITDCTCPFVKDIQKKVEEYRAKGYRIIILGNKNHPEVIGINGWCDNVAEVYSDPNEIVLKEGENTLIVEQTTYSTEKFSNFLQSYDKNLNKTVVIFSTICYTTKHRREEAEKISAHTDAVLVLGGQKSNNTDELFALCKSINSHTYRLFAPEDLSVVDIKNYKKIGIVLGASTPKEQLQEVISKMEETTEVKTEVISEQAVEENATIEQAVEAPVTEEQPETPATEEQQEVKSKKPRKEKKPMSAMDRAMEAPKFREGQVIKATIASATDAGLYLSIGSKTEVLLSKDEFLNEYKKEDFNVNDTIRVIVKALKPKLVLSEKMMKKIYEEDAKIKEIEDGKTFEATITASNKGGLSAKYLGYDVFIPMSQIKRGFVKPEELEKFVGKTFELRSTEVKRGRRKEIIASRRVILEEEYQKKEAERKQAEDSFFATVQQNDIVTGKVERFASFGAIVNVEGFDCLAHISDLSWTGCKDCSEVLKIGESYDFAVLKLDPEKKHASLGYKQLQPKPFDIYVENHQIGDVVKGKVVRLAQYGAFVELEKGVDGLVHLSQITNQWMENPVSILKVGDEIDVKIIDINVDKLKITLSIKALLQDAAPETTEEVKEEEKKSSKKTKKKDVEEEDGLREWKDQSGDVGISLADIINSKGE